MIVRDEEKRLGRCLASALPWVGEAIVVDTGSTDGTAALAAAAGARVLHFAWRDDFALARNHALGAATREWVLVLDADEILRVDDPAAWARALTQPATPPTRSPPTPSIATIASTTAASPIGPVMRLFRARRPDMVYRGEIHEQIVAVAERRCETAHARFIHIDHDGHTGAVVAEHRTLERNLRLARLMVALAPRRSLQLVLPRARRCRPLTGSASMGAEGILGVRARARDSSTRSGRPIATRAIWRRCGSTWCGRWCAPGAGARRWRPRRARCATSPTRPTCTSCAASCCSTPATSPPRAASWRTAWRRPPRASSCARIRARSATPPRPSWRSAASSSASSTAPCARSAAPIDSAPAAFHLPRFLLGIVLVSRGAAAEAEPLLAAVVSQRPQDCDARLHWARALLAIGRRGEAESALAPLGADPRVAQLLAA